jgi:NAD-specific glutamate dehydrogenase
VLNLSFARDADPLGIAQAYFGMSGQFEFALLESAIDQINTEDRWERAAARDLRTELAWARTQLCSAILDAQGNGAGRRDAAALRLKRQTEVAALMADLRALPAVGLTPLQVTVRALSRTASGV